MHRNFAFVKCTKKPTKWFFDPQVVGLFYSAKRRFLRVVKFWRHFSFCNSRFDLIRRCILKLHRQWQNKLTSIVATFGKISPLWPKFKSLWIFFDGLFSFGFTLKLFGLFLCHWSNLSCWKIKAEFHTDDVSLYLLRAVRPDFVVPHAIDFFRGHQCSHPRQQHAAL